MRVVVKYLAFSNSHNITNTLTNLLNFKLNYTVGGRHHTLYHHKHIDRIRIKGWLAVQHCPEYTIYLIILIHYGVYIAKTAVMVIIICLLLIKRKNITTLQGHTTASYDLPKPVCVPTLKMFYLKTDSLLSSLNSLISFVRIIYSCRLSDSRYNIRIAFAVHDYSWTRLRV